MESAFFTGTVIANPGTGEPNLRRTGLRTGEFQGTIAVAGIGRNMHCNIASVTTIAVRRACARGCNFRSFPRKRETQNELSARMALGPRFRGDERTNEAQARMLFRERCTDG